MTDIPNDLTTTAVFEGSASGASFGGDFETSGDIDWVKVNLVAGVTYNFYGSTDTAGPFGGSAWLTVYDSTGALVASAPPLIGLDAGTQYAATATGTYYVEIRDQFLGTGSYTLGLTNVAATDVRFSTSPDTYSALAGERVLSGGGDDTIDLGTAGLDALGGAGNDLLTGNGLANFISGGTGSDTIQGGDGADVLFGDAGDDSIYGDSGSDRIYGGDGNDHIYANDADGLLSSSDVLRGGAGDDVIVGGAGADQLLGDAGADEMSGNDGNDIYYVDDAGDSIIETSGTDKVYSTITFDLSDSLHVTGDVENLVLTGTANISGTGTALANAITGNSGDNVLSGLDGKDRLDGRTGNDHLIGGSDNDTLLGGAGQDTLTGGAGGDRLSGGLDADTFVFASVAESIFSSTSRDVILDFSTVEGDKIDLTAIDADSVTGGTQAFDFIGTDAFSHTAGELRYKVQNGNTYLYGDTNGDGKADFSVQLNHVTSIQASDFLLFPS